MRQLFSHKFFLLFFTIVILLIAINCEKKSNGDSGDRNIQANTIKIGVYYPLSGSAATFGQTGRAGIELAQIETNKAGGVLGKQIEIFVEDTRGLQDESKSAVQKLIDKDNVIAVLGEALSTNSIAGGQVCQSKGVPMISPTSTNPQVTQVGDYIFRVCFLDDFQGEVMARFAYNTLKARKVIAFYDKGSDYSVGLTKYFSEEFKKLGGEMLPAEAYQQTDADFSAQLTNIAAKNPDAIYVPGYYTQAGQIAQQARKNGIKSPLLGGDGWASPTLLEIGKDAMNGCYYSDHYSVEDPDPDVQRFVNGYKQKYHTEPTSGAASAYDAALILFDAIRRAGSTDGKALRDAIAQTKNFKGVTGSITIGPTRDAVKSAVIVGVDNNSYKVVEKMNP
jgi:branched-chain amino acid transport system substrate-binding protein